MTRAELLEKLINIKRIQNEIEEFFHNSDDHHMEADQALLDYINLEYIREPFDNVEKWYA